MNGPTLLDDRQRAFLTAARRAVLSTIAPSGRPRSVPICFVFVPAGAGGGRSAQLFSPLDDKPKAAGDPHDLARVRDLVARPEATVLVDRWSEDWDRLAWIRLDVRGELVEPGDAAHAAAVAALRAKYPPYAAHALEARPMLRFAVERVVDWGELG